MKLRELAQKIFEEDQINEDLSTKVLGPIATKEASFEIVSKEAGIFSGKSWLAVVEELTNLKFIESLNEGDSFNKNDVVIKGRGFVSELLSIERSLLNVLQQTCGVATVTNKFVKLIENAAAQKGLTKNEFPKLFHTRKTLPMLRDLQIEAIVAGGGQLHRRDLASRIMLKDNHKVLIEKSGSSYADFLKNHLTKEELESALIEVDSLEEALEIKKIGIKNVLLDNFTPEEVSKAVHTLEGINIEVSGGITESSISEYVQKGVHRISIGGLTHSVKSIDLSLEIEN